MRTLSRKSFLFCCLLFPVLAGAQIGTEVVLPEGTRICLQMNDYLSTKTNKEGDTFSATVTAPVYLKERLVIPKGSIVTGTVPRVVRPGRFRGKSQLNLLFTSIQLPDAKPLQIVACLAPPPGQEGSGKTDEGTITGEGTKAKDIAKILPPAVTGGGVGAVVDGGKGAAIGAGIGAAVGLAAVLAGRGSDVEIKRGYAMDILLVRPLPIPSEAIAPVKRDN